jgi:hypothetical protein
MPTTWEFNALVRDPMLLPPRKVPYVLSGAYELEIDGCRDEIVLDWGDSHLMVRVDGDWDTLNAEFRGQPFEPTGAYRSLGGRAPWNRLVSKECDWTWVAINKQGYCDMILMSFDVMVPQLIMHALASSIEVLTVSDSIEHQVAKRPHLRNSATESDTERIYEAYWNAFCKYIDQQGTNMEPISGDPDHPWRQFRIGVGNTWLETHAYPMDAPKRFHPGRWIGVSLILQGPHASDRFEAFRADRQKIENQIGDTLEWVDPQPGENRRRIWLRKRNTDPTHTDEWAMQHKWLREKLEKFYEVFRSRLKPEAK